jgi:hypothetical protein
MESTRHSPFYAIRDRQVAKRERRRVDGHAICGASAELGAGNGRRERGKMRKEKRKMATRWMSLVDGRELRTRRTKLVFMLGGKKRPS